MNYAGTIPSIVLVETGTPQVVPLQNAIAAATLHYNPRPRIHKSAPRPVGRPRIYTPEELRDRRRAYNHQYYRNTIKSDPVRHDQILEARRMEYRRIKDEDPERYLDIRTKDNTRRRNVRLQG